MATSPVSLLRDPSQILQPFNLITGAFYYMTLRHDYDCVNAEMQGEPLTGDSLDTRIKHPFLGSTIDGWKFVEWVGKLPYSPVSVVADLLSISFEGSATIESASEQFYAREVIALENDLKLAGENSKGEALEAVASMSFVSHVTFIAYSVLAVLGFVTTVGSFPVLSFGLLAVSTGVYFWAFQTQKDNQLKREDYYSIQLGV